jgi:hypothetical protein
MKHYHRLQRIITLLSLVIAMSLLSASMFADADTQASKTGGITGRVFLDENADAFFQECDCDCGLEHIPIRLYRDSCGGLIVQTARTNAEGFFHFDGLEPGPYCLMPDLKMICEGYQPTKSITQKVVVKAGEKTEAEWFGYDHFVDIND